MTGSLLLKRVVAIVEWFLEDYPNFDGEMPKDTFYKAFFNISGKSLSSFVNFSNELLMLGVVHKEGPIFRLRKAAYLDLKKTLLSVEKEHADEMHKKLKERLKF